MQFPLLLAAAAFMVCVTVTPARGVAYIRWGKLSCPNTSRTQLVYKGLAATSNYQSSGGGGEYLCLPDELDNAMGLPAESGLQEARNRLSGVEYKTFDFPFDPELPNPHNARVPCALCYSDCRSTKIMIPGRTTCPAKWTKEYYGYLVSSHSAQHRTSYECMDHLPERSALLGGKVVHGEFFLNEYRWSENRLGCPPYELGQEVYCVVCTK